MDTIYIHYIYSSSNINVFAGVQCSGSRSLLLRVFCLYYYEFFVSSLVIYIVVGLLFLGFFVFNASSFVMGLAKHTPIPMALCMLLLCLTP